MFVEKLKSFQFNKDTYKKEANVLNKLTADHCMDSWRMHYA